MVKTSMHKPSTIREWSHTQDIETVMFLVHETSRSKVIAKVINSDCEDWLASYL